MNEDQLQRLRQFYHSLVGQKRILEVAGAALIGHTALGPLESELRQLYEEFPGLLSTQFRKGEYHVGTEGHQVMYDRLGIESYLAMTIGRLQVAIEQSSESPVTERRQFLFITNSELKDIIERDYSEIQRAFISKNWKSVIILCGGTIEAILLDLLMSDKDKAASAKRAPKEPDITRWDLSQFINVAVELDLVGSGVETLSSPIREYRNLVHPGNEMRNKLRFGAEEAKIAIEVLHMVHRDLSK